MKVDLIMPQMGESITEGIVSRWLKKPGDRIERDESVLEISTDKVDTEIPSPAAGVLAEILVEEGGKVEVGGILARIETEQQVQPSKESAPVGRVEEAAPRKQAPKAPEAAQRKPLSPVVRNIAEKEGLTEQEIGEIRGSGPGGRVTKEDVLAYVERGHTAGVEASPEARPAEISKPSETERAEVVPMNTIRKRIAEHMVFSKHTSPHTYTVAEVDMTRIVQFRERVKNAFENREGFKLTFTPFILYATVQALKSWPILNSSVEGENIVFKKHINLGIAVALENGLIVPVIKQADEKNLLGLAKIAADLSSRARSKRLKPEEVQGGTFTVTNPGALGNVFGMAIINQPQVGILDVGAIKKRPVVIDDAIAIRSIMYVSLSYDHRIVDGEVAARFLQHIVGALENFDLDNAL